MINSLFMLGSSYNKNKIVSCIFFIAWIVYMLIGSDLSLGLTFPIINAIVFIIISISINFVKNRKLNTILSVFSILIWSIVIDIICYFLYPMMVWEQNIFSYILQGILFNGKYIFYNIIAVGIISMIETLVQRAFQKENIGMVRTDRSIL